MNDQHQPDQTTRDEYVEHLQAIMEQEALIKAANEAADRPQNPFLARIPVVAIVALVFSTVVAHNVQAWVPEPVPQPVAIQNRASQVSLLVAGERIEAFRQENGRLPASLDEVDLPSDAFVYIVDGSSYELHLAGEDAARAFYDSEAGPEALMRQLAEPIPAEG